MFHRMLKTVIKKYSVSDERVGNRLGLTAPLDKYVPVCQRHQFETDEIPRAKKNGWPSDIDFAALPERVEEACMKKRLAAVMKNPTRSFFWREIQEDVKAGGKRAVMSTAAQYATFERTLPG